VGEGKGKEKKGVYCEGAVHTSEDERKRRRTYIWSVYSRRRNEQAVFYL
jgi:hypothetical protein